MKAMILAAGRGERMRPLTDHIPKPLLEVAGQPLIAHQLRALAAAGIKDIVINVSHLGHLIQAALGSGQAYGVNIQYSVEPIALETGGGIYQALPLLGPTPFMVINGDVWCDYPLHQLPQQIAGLAHLVMVANPTHNVKGDFYWQHEQISAVGEQKLTFSGIGVYHPDLFRECTVGSFRLGDLLAQHIQAGQVTGEYFTGTWFDIGTPERLELLRKYLSHQM